jgi:hypothetical protein
MAETNPINVNISAIIPLLKPRNTLNKTIIRMIASTKLMISKSLLKTIKLLS